ncbi:MAG: YcxB family protein [Acidobacteria bacterium]|nr:YcxB family protein [Acidobacteriota bacterium]
MKIDFETDYRDYAEAYWVGSGARESARNQKFNFLILYAIVAALASIPVLFFAPQIGFGLVQFVIIFLVCLYFFRPSSRSFYEKMYRQIYGPQPFRLEIALDDEGVFLDDGRSRSTISWPRVKKISETDDFFYLNFFNNSGVKVPKRAFDGHSRIGEFKAFALARIAAGEKSIDGRNSQ